MVTDELKHIFNRMAFLKKDLGMSKANNLLLLLTIFTDEKSEASRFIKEMREKKDVEKFTALLTDMMAGELQLTLRKVRSSIKKSINIEDDLLPISPTGDIQLTSLNVDEDFKESLRSATATKTALKETSQTESILMDSMMLFYGVMEQGNRRSKDFKERLKTNLNLDSQLIGMFLMDEFSTAGFSDEDWIKSHKVSKEAGTEDKKDNEMSDEEFIKNLIEHADQLANNQTKIPYNPINNRRSNAVPDELDDDDDYPIATGAKMVKVCNMIDPFLETPLIRRDEIIEKVVAMLSQNSPKMIAIVGEKGSGLSYFSLLLNEYLNQRCSNKFQNLHYNKIYVLNEEYMRQELYKGNDGVIDFFSAINNFLQKNDGLLFIDDFGDMFNVEKDGLTEMSVVSMCNWKEKNTTSIVVTMTPSEYADNIEKSEKLRSMFVKVDAPTMSDDDVKDCINIVKREMEINHLSVINDDVIDTAITLSKKHIKNKAVPASVIRVLDLAGTFELSSVEYPQEICDIEKKYYEDQLIYINSTMNNIMSAGNHSSKKDIDEIYFDSESIRKKDKLKLKSKIKKFNKDTFKNASPIKTESIEKAITMLTGIPAEQMNEDEVMKVARLSTNLKSEVIGQEGAIETVVRTMKRRAVGLSANKSKTIGNLIFCGESGVGKTELAKKIAKYMFGDEKNMVRIDMSEFSERHTMSKLIGTSAGFVGYENDGILTKAVREKKYCVVLLDEMEKAAPEIFNLFLQVFDDGRLTTGQGEFVDFSNTLIIMTSNVGARKSQEMGDGIGFQKKDNYKQDIFEKELHKEFAPEFLNRIDNIVLFNHLTEDNLHTITELQLERLKRTIADTSRTLVIGTGVKEIIVAEANKEKNMGARPINRAIQNMLENPIADLIVDNAPKDIKVIVASAKDGKIVIEEGLDTTPTSIEISVPKTRKKRATKKDAEKKEEKN